MCLFDSGFSGCGSIAAGFVILPCKSTVYRALSRESGLENTSSQVSGIILSSMQSANARFGAESLTKPRLTRCGWRLHSTGMAQVRRQENSSSGRLTSSLHVLLVGQAKVPRVSG
jgi:hypothetical protein